VSAADQPHDQSAHEQVNDRGDAPLTAITMRSLWKLKMRDGRAGRTS
jgi:hypothetical protein